MPNPKKVEFKKPYEPRKRVPTLVVGHSLAKQHHKNECDINGIMAKFQRTGLITHVNQNAARYGDLPGPDDFQNAMNLVIDAQNLFESLPSDLRDRFNNDPSKYLAFCEDPENHDEMVKLGLLDPPAPEKPEPATSGDPEPSGDPSEPEST